MGHPMRPELTLAGLLVKLANHYTTRGAPGKEELVMLTTDRHLCLLSIYSEYSYLYRHVRIYANMQIHQLAVSFRKNVPSEYTSSHCIHLSRFQFDTASDIILILRSIWTLISKPGVVKTKHIARSGSGDVIQLIDELSCDVSFNNQKFVGLCYHGVHILISLEPDWIEKLDLFNVSLTSVFNSKLCFRWPRR